MLKRWLNFAADSIYFYNCRKITMGFMCQNVIAGAKNENMCQYATWYLFAWLKLMRIKPINTDVYGKLFNGIVFASVMLALGEFRNK